MPQDDRATRTRYARRWADTAWRRGWHAHAIDVLDRAIELNPTCYKLHRKRGVFYLLCPDPKVRDEEQAFTDLQRACDLSEWREELVGWVIELLTNSGEVSHAKEIKRELAGRARRSADGT